MSRILRRPMFRGGRVESKGDLKVIDQMGIANLATGGRVGFEHGGSHGTGGEIEDYTDIIEAVRASRPKRKGMSTSDYLRIASAGADILGAPSEGSGIFGALRSSAPALSKLGTDMAAGMDARNVSEEEAITDISGAIMKSRNYRPDRGFNVDRKMQLIEENVLLQQEIEAALLDDESIVKYIKDKELKITTAEQIEALKIDLRNKKQLAKLKLKELLPKNENMAAFLKTSQARLLFASVIAAEERRQGILQNDPMFDTDALIDAINRIGQKDGGLTTGYNEGGLTEMVSETETINGPSTDAEIDEQYGAGASEDAMNDTMAQNSAPLTYEELRQRLPKEIPDDVIILISKSDQAMLDFSNIATQQDVDEFNVKYGVELVLPQV